MSIIIGLGSNLGDKKSHIENAISEIEKITPLIKTSRLYSSAAVDYTDQPDFYNCAAEFKIPTMGPQEFMTTLLQIEKEMGRVRDIDKGPRTIDLDILFWGTEEINTSHLSVPHPRWQQRSFVVKPLQELPFFKTLEKCFIIPTSFNTDSIVVTD